MITDRNARGEAPPQEWWTEQGGHASYAQYREWVEAKDVPHKQKKPHKFHANRGFREDLGHLCESSLEANCERYLRFVGYQPWPGKEDPPGEGRWYRYEGAEYLLTTARGRVIGYTPDFHIWEDGKHSLVETKGVLDQRSKQRLRNMAKAHPELPVDLVTYEELKIRKAEALYEARRQNRKILDIAGWEG